MNAKTYKIGLLSALSALMIFSGNTAFAAPGKLSDTPLFVTTTVEPNIFFTLDDSGSMDWEAIIPDTGLFARYNNGVTQFNGDWQAYLHPGWSNYKYYAYSSYNNYDRNIIPPAAYSNTSTSTLIQSFWVMQNHNYNTLYYNPLTEYKPWKGVDSSGNPLYQPADPREVTRDPNDVNHTGDTVDLTQRFDYYDNIVTDRNYPNITYLPSYYEWTDDNTDGVLQATETHTLVEIDPTVATYSHKDKDGNVVLTRSGQAELQNFANWFEYYRKREFATKATIGGVINTAGGSRMGLRLINGGHQVNLRTMTDATNKQNLIDTFYNIDSNGGTPLRRALNYTGSMYMSTSTYNGESVILPASQGGECQQNFALLMTDGFWNGTSPYVGNTDHSSDSVGFDGDQNESNDGGNYEDDYSDTLADVAMRYYETDLRTDLGNKVPTSPGVDEADHQHMVTYTISFGVTGTLDINTYDPLAAGFAWPQPNTDPRKVDDLIHAAYNARGLYLSAQNPVELEASLSAALADIEERKATQSAVSVTSARLTTDSVVFVSEFNTSGWQGNLFAYPIVENNGILSLNIPSDPMNAVNAAEALSLQASNGGYDSSRVILSNNGTAGVPFRWANISSDMQADLRINVGGSTGSDDAARARLNFIRGDTSNEGTGLQFRERAKITPNPATPLTTVTNVLGDIVHSGSVYVAQPNLNWPDEAPFPTGSESYSTFKENQASRAGMIYVGANDGMVHGFSAADLTEKIAYVPNNLASTNINEGLHYLTEPGYKHRYYNDLSPTVSDIYINGAWHTIIITGQRAGGRGYSALDVTNPTFSEATAAQTVLWEFNNLDDPDLGYTFSQPQIGLANDGEWVAVFGNGYNSDGNGQASLFIVKIRAGIDGTWAVTDYTKISTGSGTLANPNGLATPALADLNGDGTIDRAYAGDLFGQMWAFDLSDSSPGNWQLAYGSSPLFETINNRPITTQPSLSFHPTIDTSLTNTPNVMVTFGTGQYMVDADKNSTNDNYYYGVWDSGTSNLRSTDLVEQTFTSSNPRVLTRNSVDYSSEFGWYIGLDITHERSITDSFIRSGYVFFNTSIPSNDTCLSDGYGYRFVVDLATGGTPKEPVIDVNNSGEVDSSDTISGLIPAAQELSGGNPTADTPTESHILNERNLTKIKDAPIRQTGRVSWQELLQ